MFQSLPGNLGVPAMANLTQYHERVAVSIPSREFGSSGYLCGIDDNGDEWGVSIPSREFGSSGSGYGVCQKSGRQCFNPFQGIWEFRRDCRAGCVTVCQVSIPSREFGSSGLPMFQLHVQPLLLFQSLPGNLGVPANGCPKAERVL